LGASPQIFANSVSEVWYIFSDCNHSFFFFTGAPVSVPVVEFDHVEVFSALPVLVDLDQ